MSIKNKEEKELTGEEKFYAFVDSHKKAIEDHTLTKKERKEYRRLLDNWIPKGSYSIKRED
jgi:hypothetical protein